MSEVNSNTDFDRLYKERRAKEEKEAQAAVDKQIAKDNAKNAKLAKSQTVRFSLLQTNGEPIHLCEDGEWRTNNDLSKIGVEE